MRTRPGGASNPAQGGTPESLAPKAFARHLSDTAAQGARASAGSPEGTYRIKSGDTLSQIALDRLRQIGRPHTAADIHRAVHSLAQSNRIANPDRILAGDFLDLSSLGAGPAKAAHNLTPAQPPRGLQSVSAATHPPPATGSSPGSSGKALHPVLERTLDRAVQSGYLSSTERQPVHDRILELSKKYRFSPDDFATVSLIESDGLNPRASNGRCFGIIQFCGGSQAGAAAVGMADGAEQIMERPVIEQLELVDRYFEHNGLQRLPQVGLVDLYLTILTPAAKRERAPDAPLPIAGTQARVLHENQDRRQPITRKSILAGLVDHARQMLAAHSPVRSARDSGKPGGNNLPLAGNRIELKLRRPG